MSQTPTRKPRFLSTVPPQQEVQLARFGQSGAPMIRPLAYEPRPAFVKPGAAIPSNGATAHQSLNGAQSHAQPAPPRSAAEIEQGLHQQLQAAATELEAQRKEMRERLAAAIESLRLQSERLAEQARADALEIAFQLARKIVEVELRTSPEPLFALVRSSLQQLAAARRITLHVSAHDLEALRSPRGHEAMSAISLAQIELFPDASLETGECLIESDLGQIDGRLANRFSELRRTVDEAKEGAA